MALLKYTTKIDADKTAGEIAKILSSAGAKAVLTEYNEKTNCVEAISFKINLNEKEIGFRLPTDWKPVLQILENDRKIPRSFVSQEQAVRVAWRIVLAWTEAQVALIATKMVKTEEVFLPYIITKSGDTLYQQFKNNPDQLLLN